MSNMIDLKDFASLQNLAETPSVNRPGRPLPALGHYHVRREIGRGGMSVVYEAVDTRTGQDVALKLLALPPTLAAADADALVARFEREARTMARLSHPNIIGIHEIGVVQGQHFLAMEFLRGQTLRERMTRRPLLVREAYSVLSQIAGALDAVHAAEIVHRDVKASNVMLLPDGTAKLLDFGIARSREEAEITSAGAILGTPSYMAPEQVRGEPATVTTDLWSLGVLSYEMLTGHLPFVGQVVANVLYQVLNSPPAPAPGLPKPVQKVLRRALDKDPAQRYLTAGALAEALEAALPQSVLPPVAAPNLGAAPRRAVPRWAQGAALLLLFLGAFSYTALHRHQGISAGRKTDTQKPAAQPAAAEAAPTAAGAPVTNVLPAPVYLTPAAAPRQAPETRQARSMRQSWETRPTEQAAVQSAEELPQTNRQPRVRVKESAAIESAAAGTAALPEPETTQAARNPAPEPMLRHRVTTNEQPVISARPPERVVRPPADAVQQSPARPASVPEAVQGVTLPASGDSDDPEAEARLRKSTWSQNSSQSVP